MRIEQFEDIEAWQLARELTRKVYGLTKKAKFVCGASKIRLFTSSSTLTFK
jgi:hypothetical protein